MSFIIKACYSFTSRNTYSLLRLQSPSSTVNRLISKKTYDWPEVKDSDIDVFYIRGSGPGGQAVQKANNCVQIRHNPTGIVIKCHETRSGSENYRLALKKLKYHLDMHYNKENSYDALVKKEQSEKKYKNQAKKQKKQALKREFKEREGLT